MSHPPRIATTANVIWTLLLLVVAPMLGACSGGSEERGRIKVRSSQVVGIYELRTDTGSERLEIKQDGTYLQDIVSDSQVVHHNGKWRIKNHFLDGSELALDDASSHLSMYVHDRSGKIGLARNEVAEWYYDSNSLTRVSRYSFTAIPNAFIFRYMWLRSRPRTSAVRLTLP